MSNEFESIFKSTVRSFAASFPGAASLAQAWSEVEQHDMGNRMLEIEAAFADMRKRSVAPSEPPREPNWLRVTHQFLSRTCRVGIKNGRRFKVVGFCCLIDDGVALTSDITVQQIDSFVAQYGGQPEIMSQTGFAPLQVQSDKSARAFRILRFGEFDNSYWNSISETPSAELAPLMTRATLRRFPFAGEELSVCVGSESLEDITLLQPCECLRLLVVAPLRTEPISLSFHLMSACLARPQYTGGPCFDRDGKLLGVVADVLRDPDGRSYRIVLGNFVESGEIAKYVEGQQPPERDK